MSPCPPTNPRPRISRDAIHVLRKINVFHTARRVEILDVKDVEKYARLLQRQCATGQIELDDVPVEHRHPML